MDPFWAGFGWGALTVVITEVVIVVALLVIYAKTQSNGKKSDPS